MEIDRSQMTGWDKDIQDLTLLALEWGWTPRWVKRGQQVELSAPDGQKALRFGNGTKPAVPSASQLRRQIEAHGTDPNGDGGKAPASEAPSVTYGTDGVIEAIRAMVAPDMVSQEDYDEALRLVEEQGSEIELLRRDCDQRRRDLERVTTERDALKSKLEKLHTKVAVVLSDIEVVIR